MLLIMNTPLVHKSWELRKADHSLKLHANGNECREQEYLEALRKIMRVMRDQIAPLYTSQFDEISEWSDFINGGDVPLIPDYHKGYQVRAGTFAMHDNENYRIFTGKGFFTRRDIYYEPHRGRTAEDQKYDDGLRLLVSETRKILQDLDGIKMEPDISE